MDNPLFLTRGRNCWRFSGRGVCRHKSEFCWVGILFHDWGCRLMFVCSGRRFLFCFYLEKLSWYKKRLCSSLSFFFIVGFSLPLSFCLCSSPHLPFYKKYKSRMKYQIIGTTTQKKHLWSFFVSLRRRINEVRRGRGLAKCVIRRLRHLSGFLLVGDCSVPTTPPFSDLMGR